MHLSTLGALRRDREQLQLHNQLELRIFSWGTILQRHKNGSTFKMKLYNFCAAATIIYIGNPPQINSAYISGLIPRLFCSAYLPGLIPWLFCSAYLPELLPGYFAVHIYLGLAPGFFAEYIYLCLSPGYFAVHIYLGLSHGFFFQCISTWAYPQVILQCTVYLPGLIPRLFCSVLYIYLGLSPGYFATRYAKDVEKAEVKFRDLIGF
jgi:hypothetical protein